MRREPERPQRVASATMRAISAGASGDGRGTERGVARAWPVTWQARPLRHRVLVRAGGCRPAPLGRAQQVPLRRPATAQCPAPDRPQPLQPTVLSRSRSCSRLAWSTRSPPPPAASGHTLARPRRGGGRPTRPLPPARAPPPPPAVAADLLGRVPLACHADSLRTGPNPRTGSGPVLGGGGGGGGG